LKNLKIICAIKAVPVSNTDNKSAEIITEEYELEKQHGSWNKDIIKWWIKGEPDEFFAERENFMRRVFNTAFTEWDIEIPLVFIQAKSEEDADIIIEWGTRQNDPYYSGDNGKYVLAYAGYPSGRLKGYMKIFTHWDWDVKGRLNIITVVIHELGHLIGRPHSIRKLWKDIMDPIINRLITELSDWDIAGAVAEYGAREYKHLTAKQAAEIAKKSNSKKLILTHVSQRYSRKPEKILNEAKKIFKNSSLAHDLEVIEI